MNKFGEEFMNKFELYGTSIEEFFGKDMDLINEVVNKKGWFKYENSFGEYVEIEYVGEEIDEEEMKELREDEKLFLGDGSEDYDGVIDIKEDFIDLEDVCYVRVG